MIPGGKNRPARRVRSFRGLRGRALACATGLAIVLGTGACQGPLVHEEYASFGTESVNGVDAMLGILEGEGRKVVLSPYLTRKIMETADIVVYFSRGEEHVEDLARIESWLHEVPYRPPPAIFQADEATRRPPRPALPGTREIQAPPENAPGTPETENSPPASGPEAQTEPEPLAPEEIEKILEEGETAEQPVAPDNENESVSEDESAGEQATEEGVDLAPPARETPVTLLYFGRDTDASVPFWDRLRRQMAGHEREEQFAADVLALRLEEREGFPEHEEILFGRRKLLDRAGRPIPDGLVHPQLGARTLPDFPVRFVPRLPESYYANVELPFRTLVETRQGYDLIREFVVRQGRVIYSYNAEWALNYSLVRKPYRELAEDLVDYAARNHSSAAPIKIYWITRSLQPLPEIQQEESSILRPFTVFPLNVVLLQMLLLLILFLLSRWPHERRPSRESTRGKREFLEHIRFLGMKLRRSKNPFDALEPLGAYVKRNRYDSARWERAIADLYASDDDSRTNDPGPEAAGHTNEEEQKQ